MEFYEILQTLKRNATNLRNGKESNGILQNIMNSLTTIQQI